MWFKKLLFKRVFINYLRKTSKQNVIHILIKNNLGNNLANVPLFYLAHFRRTLLVMSHCQHLLSSMGQPPAYSMLDRGQATACMNRNRKWQTMSFTVVLVCWLFPVIYCLRSTDMIITWTCYSSDILPERERIEIIPTKTWYSSDIVLEKDWNNHTMNIVFQWCVSWKGLK